MVIKCLCLIISSILYQQCLALDVLRTDKEKTDQITIMQTKRVPYVIYSIGPLLLKKNDIVDIRLQAVLTNECKGNVGIGRYLTRSKSSLSTQGWRVVKSVMSNASRDDHHDVLIHSGIEFIENTSDDNYYNFVVFAQSTQCEGQALTVEGYDNDGFGELLIVIK